MPTIRMEKAFMAGLRDDVRSPRNAEVLALCTNAKASQWGAGRHDPISWPITDVAIADVASEFPNASLFRGKSRTILARRNAIHEVNESTWAAGTAQTIYRMGPPLTESMNNPSFATATGGVLDKWTAGGSALNNGVPNNGWTYSQSNGSVAHSSGTMPLQQAGVDQAVILQVGHRYRVKFTITGMTAGSIRAYCGTAAGTARTQNKTWTEDIVCAGNTTFLLTPTGDFNGTITDCSVKEVKTGTIPTGSGPWHLADFQDCMFLCNGSCLVARLYLYGLWGWFVAQDDGGTYTLAPKTVVNYRNRLLIGGLPASTAWFSDANWQTLWKTWIEHSPKDVMTYQDLVMGPNVWVYSDLGGGDYYWPFIPELAMLGVLGQTEVETLGYLYIDRIKTGAIGFIPMPWQGNILAGAPIGDALATYGDGGGTAIVPQAEDGLAIYRTIERARIGIAARGAAGGDADAQAFFDKAGVVWTMGPDLQLTRRGYAEFVSPLADANTVVTLDPDQRDFHITDGVTGYVVSKTGLGRSTRFPTNLSYISTGLIGVYAPASAEDVTFEIITDTFDMGVRGIKTIKSVEIGATNVTILKVAVEFKFANGTTFFRTAEVAVTDEGIAFPIASGADFRLRLTGTWGTNGKIDYANIDWNQTDKRSVGGYVSGR